MDIVNVSNQVGYRYRFECKSIRNWPNGMVAKLVEVQAPLLVEFQLNSAQSLRG
jgi:hypothetical protein